MRFRKLALAFGLGLVLAACSSGGNMKVLSSAPATNLPAQPSVRLVVNAVAKDSGDILVDVRATVLGQLEATGRYSKVSVGPEPSDLSSTNATVKSFEANGESAAHPFSSEGGLSDAIREVAKQISAAS